MRKLNLAMLTCLTAVFALSFATMQAQNNCNGSVAATISVDGIPVQTNRIANVDYSDLSGGATERVSQINDLSIVGDDFDFISEASPENKFVATRGQGALFFPADLDGYVTGSINHAGAVYQMQAPRMPVRAVAQIESWPPADVVLQSTEDTVFENEFGETLTVLAGAEFKMKRQ